MPLSPEDVERALSRADLRHRAVSPLTENLPARGPGTAAHKAGTLVRAASAAGIAGFQNPVFFDLPDASGIFAVAARHHFQQWKARNPLLGGAEEIEDPSTAFDLFAEAATSVISGHAAIEAAVNEVIPADKKYSRKNRKGKPEQLSGADVIERRLSLDEKLTSVVPQLLGIPSPESLDVWSDYARLRDLRHRLIHAKKEDTTNWNGVAPIPDTIWGRLLDPTLPDPGETAFRMVAHIARQPVPFWVQRWNSPSATPQFE